MRTTDLVQLRTPTDGWVTVCRYAALEPACGVTALLPDGGQAAVFRLPSGEVLAVGNRDPFSGAGVIADGITGSVDGVPIVASPMHKQTFDLRTGHCLDDPERALPSYPTRLVAPAG
ncbi:oxidoreductase [Kitasatospora sp. MMS16-BH015]|uniref:nitrite reductase small subunit NirD n=1 Tax=Kitasatospora sp. MMS16-BH015 TaxID=2018025 RepID=UPI000CA136E3|nr:nitrite reductase small subunit NirD [Kitasatospora sp. MMS16-BH015]AUG77369.1 oxidoreductase [Kitasatospora sp. MMS16-BH015]